MQNQFVALGEKMKNESDSIFTKIINGEIPCHKIYEDELVFAFLDINPCSTGHTLVVSKEQAETLDKLSEKSSMGIGRVLPIISKSILEVTGAKEFNILQNNGPNALQTVFHVHFHIIPKFDDGSGLSIPFRSNPINHDEGKELASKIKNLLN